MKKHLLFYLLFVLLAMNARAQSTTVTLGTGAVASSAHGPVFVSNQTRTGGHISQHAAIYSASEINATSFAAKVLTKIAWNKNDTSRYNKNNGILKIYVKQTTLTAIPAPFPGDVVVANEIAGATLVYSSTTQNISAGAGWKTFDLQTPFIWNGTSNLEIVVDWSEPGLSTGTAPMEWATTPVTTDISAYFADATSPGYIYLTTNRPNAQLTFTEFSNDAGISAITAPAPIFAPGASPVQATVKNFGNNALTAATIGWKVNGVAQPDFSWTGNLPSGQTASASILGNFTFMFGSSTIKAYTKSSNGVTDPLKINDTTTIKVIACTALSGNYTINKNAPASATNLKSFTEAALVLNSCGVSGPVTFTVAPGSGPYNEAFELKNVTGVSATNTITFEGNGNTLTTELISSRPATIKIDNVPYVKINNLVVTTTSTTIFTGYGIQFLNQSHFATVSNCTINMPQINSASNIVGLVIGVTHNGSGDNSSNSLFENNTVNGGYYSMRINGKPAVAPATNPIGAVNVRVINNQFKDFSNNGIYLSYADGVKIDGNTFTRPTRTDAAAFVGISLVTACRNTIINKNRFYNTHGGATLKTGGVTGIDVQIAAPVGAENIVKNNVFYDLNNTGTITVLSTYTSTTEGVYFYHNTISLDCPGRLATNTSVLKAFNLAGPGANVKFINNVVTINSLGTGIKAAMYLAGTPAATFVSNNNVFYVAPGQTAAYVGYVPAVAPAPIKTATTLAAWQALYPASPYDVNSVEVNPGFIDLTAGNLKPTATLANNAGQGGLVTDDILGVTRNITTPDPGAYEFDLVTNDAGITAITAPNSGCNLTNAEVVTIIIKNFGPAALTNIPVSYTINGGAAVNEMFTGSIASNASVNYSFTATANLAAPGSYSIVASANLATDVLATNNSFTKVVVASAPAAVPTITAGGPVSLCTGGSVVLTAASTTTGATYAWHLNGTAITGATSATYTANAAGSYTVIATANGCPSAASAATTITVNAAPVIPTITNSGTTTFCAGGSVTFTAASTTPGGNFPVVKNGTAITGATSSTCNATTAGSYTVTATSNGCSATSTAAPVTVNATPATPTISQSGFVLTSSSTAGNQWYLNGTPITGATGATYTSTANGNYTLMVTTNGCSSAASAAVTIVNTGFKDDQNMNITVYPNPSEGLVNLTLPKGRVYEMIVTDLTGKVVLTQKLTTDKTQINLSKAAKGIYLLKVSGENGSAVRKLIVE